MLLLNALEVHWHHIWILRKNSSKATEIFDLIISNHENFNLAVLQITYVSNFKISDWVFESMCYESAYLLEGRLDLLPTTTRRTLVDTEVTGWAEWSGELWECYVTAKSQLELSNNFRYENFSYFDSKSSTCKLRISLKQFLLIRFSWCTYSPSNSSNF
jgi:hypothetical protein